MRIVASIATIGAALLPVLAAPAAAAPAPAGPPPAVDPGDGAIPVGVTLSPYDVLHPAIGRLDPPLLRAVQDAARDAAGAGIDMRVSSGWRSAGLQQRMLDDAVATYGSVAAARQWVALPEVSSHVTGRAVDISPPAAADWLVHHGPRFGLCRIYANEWWHFELATHPFGVCPPLLPDATG